MSHKFYNDVVICDGIAANKINNNSISLYDMAKNCYKLYNKYGLDYAGEVNKHSSYSNTPHQYFGNVVIDSLTCNDIYKCGTNMTDAINNYKAFQKYYVFTKGTNKCIFNKIAISDEDYLHSYYIEHSFSPPLEVTNIYSSEVRVVIHSPGDVEITTNGKTAQGVYGSATQVDKIGVDKYKITSSCVFKKDAITYYVPEYANIEYITEIASNTCSFTLYGTNTGSKIIISGITGKVPDAAAVDYTVTFSPSGGSQTFAITKLTKNIKANDGFYKFQGYELTSDSNCPTLI